MFRSRPERPVVARSARRGVRFAKLAAGLAVRGFVARGLTLTSVVALACVCACGSLRDPYSSSFTLRVAPAPPVAGAPMYLTFQGQNVGLIRVYQDGQELASYVNAVVDGVHAYEVVAVSNSMPTAKVDGVNGAELNVVAEPSWGYIAPPDPEPEPEPESFEESCPDATLVDTYCSQPGSESVHVRVRNDGYTSVTGYHFDQTCVSGIVTIMTDGQVYEADYPSGSVLRFLDDSTAQVVRDLRLGSTACDLVIAPQ